MRSKERSYYHLLEDGLTGGVGAGLVERMVLSGLPPLAGSPRPFRGKPKTGGERERRAWIEQREILIRRASDSIAVVTPSGEAGHGTMTEPRGGEGRGEEGRLFGLAFHHLMETVDPAAESVDDSIVRAAAERFRLAGTGELGRLVERALRSDLLAEARSSGDMHREVPFTLLREGFLAEGRIDLIYRTEGGWRIVDYKTDDPPPDGIDSRFEAYRGQGMLYALAASRIVGEPVESVLFFFVRSGEVREIPVTDDLLERYEMQLTSRIRD